MAFIDHGGCYEDRTGYSEGIRIAIPHPRFEFCYPSRVRKFFVHVRPEDFQRVRVPQAYITSNSHRPLAESRETCVRA
jgi:hypothetical protein